MNIGKGMLGILVKAVLLGGFAVGGAASAAGYTVANNVPPAVAKARLVGHHNPLAVLDVRVVLPLRNGAALAQLLHDQQDRSSPSYHQFLTPAQFKAQFGPSDAQVTQVVKSLEAAGIKVTGISSDNTRVHATASTAVLERAFSVAINNYSYGGKSFFAPSSNPRLPSGMTVPVMAVLGLDNAVTFQAHSLPGRPAPTARGLLGPQGFMPSDIATAYAMPDITNAANGAGVTIAIATAYNFRPQDLVKFWTAAGVTARTGGSTGVSVVAVDGRPTKVLDGETTLDIERSGAVAPGAHIKVYECVNPAFVNFDDEFNEIAADASVQVVSTSWGTPESETPLSSVGAEHQTFVTMAAEGMTLFAAAGDAGAGDGVPGQTDAADFPASDPYVVSAGGTVLSVDPNTGLRTTEEAWSGAGGADSGIFAAPSYQATPITGLTPNTACTKDYTSAPGAATDFGPTVADLCAHPSDPSRQNSDLALNAGAGYAIYYNDRWQSWVGTSFVAPQLAGYFADVLQQAVAASKTLVGANLGLGRGNDLIYCVGTGANGTSPAADIFDVTDGSNGPLGVFDAGAGWDHPTGFGTLLDGNLLATDIITNCL